MIFDLIFVLEGIKTRETYGKIEVQYGGECIS
jgi:hypothetical protein